MRRVESNQYYNKTASEYDKIRQKTEIYPKVQGVITQWLNDLNLSCAVDCPIGTGRFIEQYEKLKMQVFGYDISQDMLNVAKSKVTNDNIKLINKNIENVSDYKMDLFMCVGFLYLLTQNKAIKTIDGICRTEPKYIIFTDTIFHSEKVNPIKILVRKLLHPHHHNEKKIISKFNKLKYEIKDEKTIRVDRTSKYKCYLMKRVYKS